MNAEKKKGSRKRGFLGCFEAPAVADEHVQEEKERRATSSSEFLPVVCAGQATSCPSRWLSLDKEGKARRGEGSGKRKPFSPRLLAKIVRSAVFVTSLQKARYGKAWQVTKQMPPPEASGAPVGASRRTWDEDEPSSEAAFSSSSLSSSSSGSSAFSTITSSSRPPLPQMENVPEGKKSPELPFGGSTGGGDSGGDDDATSTGLCLVVLFVLFVLVFWGRLCAIIWTSGCLCFVLGRGWSDGTVERKEPRRGSPAGGGSSRRGQAEWEKRRVVLEGLLDKRRRL